MRGLRERNRHRPAQPEATPPQQELILPLSKRLTPIPHTRTLSPLSNHDSLRATRPEKKKYFSHGPVVYITRNTKSTAAILNTATSASNERHAENRRFPLPHQRTRTTSLTCPRRNTPNGVYRVPRIPRRNDQVVTSPVP